MSIYYVRHGQTDWNKLGYLQGQSDIPLNEEGIKQARQVRDALKQVHIDKIICSPLDRTRQTAAIINENHGLTIDKDERIKERYFGEVEGAHRNEIVFEDFWKWEKPVLYGMESIEELFQRVYSFLDDLMDEAINQNILVVAHGGVSIPFQCYFDEENRKKDLISLILKNCEVAQRECKVKVK